MKIAIIGLGYVGLPLAVEFCKKHTVNGIAVAHDQFKTLGIDGLRQWANDRAVIYDIKSMFPRNEVDGRL